MNPEKIGKTLGIGLRVAGRIAQQRAEQASPPAPQPVAPSTSSNTAAQLPPQTLATANQPPSPAPRTLNAANSAAKAHKYTRAAGRGLGGFLRPFGRVGGILWLEITGFFFGLFALYFAQDIWRTRLSYATGPQHQRFLIAVALTVVFGYLSASAFWRARRK